MSVINAGAGGRPLPVLTNPGGAGDLLAGKQLIDQYGNPITGLIPTKGAGDLTVSGAGIIVPAGYYAEQVSKEVPAAAQAVPTISVSSAGLITASAAQEAGYVAAGSKSATKQLTTQAGKTITPGTTQQTAVASGRYTTGAVYVAGSSNLTAANIKSGVNIFGVTGTYAGDQIRNELVDLSSLLSGYVSSAITFSLTDTPKRIYSLIVYSYKMIDEPADNTVVMFAINDGNNVTFHVHFCFNKYNTVTNGFSYGGAEATYAITISGKNVTISSDFLQKVQNDGSYGFYANSYRADVLYSY